MRFLSRGNDASGRSGDEVEQILHLRNGRHSVSDFFDALLKKFSVLIEDSIGVMDGFDNFGFEATTTQTDVVQSAVGNGLASSNAERRNVLACAGAAANHDVTTNVAELMNQDVGAENGKVIDDHLSGNFRGVTNDASVPKDYVVCDVHSLHEKIVAADNGFAFCRSTSIDSDVFSNGVVVADFSGGFLSLELQVLRYGSDDCARENGVVTSHACAGKQGYAVHERVVVADFYVFVDVAERNDLKSFTDDGFGMNKS